MSGRDRTIQIGIRGAQNSTEAWDYSDSSGMRVVFMEEVTQVGVEAVALEAVRIAGGQPTYVSFDIESIDPAFAPGTGTPEIGGVTSVEVLTLLRALRGIQEDSTPDTGPPARGAGAPLDPTGSREASRLRSALWRWMCNRV